MAAYEITRAYYEQKIREFTRIGRDDLADIYKKMLENHK